MRLTLTTLGSAGLSRGDEELLGPGKLLALIAYLALTPGRAATREFLLDLLWADLPPDRARHSLRQTLWQLRQLLGDDAVDGRAELSLTVGIASDRDLFIAAVESGDPEAAITVYRGDFLPDFALPGSTGFEYWADIERSRLRATFLRAGEMAARRRLAEGRHREAQEIARRMRDTDRLNETGWRVLLEACMAGGNLVQAVTEAEALRSTLAAEEREPEPATAALLDALRRAPEGSPDRGRSEATTLIAELVGREHEFATVIDGWSQASRGQSRHLHLSAPAGFGKSRLLADIAHRLRSIGARVVHLRANPGDRSVRYGVAGDLAHALGALPGLPAVSPGTADVLVDLSPSLSARLPGAKPLRSTAERLRLRTAAIAEAIAAIAEEHPLALLVDDVHWLDPESHQVLSGMIHRLDRVPVLVVTAGRPGLGPPITSAGSTELGLEPLELAGVKVLFASLGRLPDESLLDEVAKRLHRASGGSPLLVLESIQLALGRNAISLEDGVWSVPDPGALLAELDTGNAIRTRLADLAPDAAWVMLVLATAGTRLSGAELATTVKASDSLDDLLWSLERKRFVRRADTSWEPVHDEIAAAVLAAESAERRRAAHVAVGRILLERESDRLADTMQAARHFHKAGDETRRAEAYRRAVALSRTTADGRSLRQLAEAITGSDEAASSRLVRTLPLRTRLGLHSTARLAAVALVLLAAIGAGWAWQRRMTPNADASLILLLANRTDSTAVDVATLSFDRRSWRSNEPLRTEGPTRTIRDPTLRRVAGFDVSPVDQRWAFAAEIDPGAGEDVFLRDNRRSRLFFTAPGPDDTPKWSPDGRRLVFSTGGWASPGVEAYDLAVGDVRTGKVIQLTRGDDSEVGPAWAPHGGLIAFVRNPESLRPREACWITVDGRVEHCVPSTIGEVTYTVGWLDDTRVLLRIEENGQYGFVRWNLVNDRFEHVPSTLVGAAAWLSPDARWVLCHCARDNAEPPALVAFPVDDPGAVRKLAVDKFITVAWAPAGRLDQRPTLRVRQRRIELPTDAEDSPVAMVTDSLGERIGLPAGVLRWTIRDSSVATVDSVSGRITAHRPGRTIVMVDFAGLVRDSIDLAITAGSVTMLVRETWSSIDSTRWLDFGSPLPHLAVGPDGIRGLNNGGDGIYASGLLTRDSLDPAAGLGVEARLSLPISRSRGQRQSLSLTSLRQLPSGSWDRRSGTGRLDPAAINEQCTLGYPSGPGMSGTGRISFWAAGVDHLLPVDSSWRKGHWHLARLQLFPDGTCGFALDGVPLWRSATRVPVDTWYRLWLSGNSVETKLVVGPLELWRGIRQDVDWRQLRPEP